MHSPWALTLHVSGVNAVTWVQFDRPPSTYPRTAAHRAAGADPLSCLECPRPYDVPFFFALLAPWLAEFSLPPQS